LETLPAGQFRPAQQEKEMGKQAMTERQQGCAQKLRTALDEGDKAAGKIWAAYREAIRSGLSDAQIREEATKGLTGLKRKGRLSTIRQYRMLYKAAPRAVSMLEARRVIEGRKAAKPAAAADAAAAKPDAPADAPADATEAGATDAPIACHGFTWGELLDEMAEDDAGRPVFTLDCIAGFLRRRGFRVTRASRAPAASTAAA
jgi:membrane protein involved in colicin uptake